MSLNRRLLRALAVLSALCLLSLVFATRARPALYFTASVVSVADGDTITVLTPDTRCAPGEPHSKPSGFFFARIFTQTYSIK